MCCVQDGVFVYIVPICYTRSYRQYTSSRTRLANQPALTRCDAKSVFALLPLLIMLLNLRDGTVEFTECSSLPMWVVSVICQTFRIDVTLVAGVALMMYACIYVCMGCTMDVSFNNRCHVVSLRHVTASLAFYDALPHGV